MVRYILAILLGFIAIVLSTSMAQNIIVDSSRHAFTSIDLKEFISVIICLLIGGSLAGFVGKKSERGLALTLGVIVALLDFTDIFSVFGKQVL